MLHMHSSDSPIPGVLKKRTGLLAGAATLALAGLLAGCSAGAPATPSTTAASGGAGEEDALSALYEEAKAEGTLTWYTSIVPDNMDQIKAAFESQFPGITLQALRLGGTEGPLRFSSEMEAGAVSSDVLTTSEGDFPDQALEEGWTKNLEDFDLPTLEDYPADFVRGPQIVSQVSPIQFLYNTETAEAPASWEDLLEEDWKDQLMLVDPRAILPWMAQYSLLYDTYGAEYLEGIADQDYRLVDSAIPGAQALAAGESRGLFPSLPSVANPLKEQGAPVENAVLEPFTGVENTTIINAEAEHANAAKLFVAWIATPEGQEAFNGNFAASPMEDIPNAESLGDGYIPYDIAEVNANRDAVLAALGIQ
jgi:iron(III) transport system substrate-binding protein